MMLFWKNFLASSLFGRGNLESLNSTRKYRDVQE